MKTFLACLALVCSGAANAVIIAQWNFNGESSGSVPGGPNSPLPSVGSGTASLLGGVTGAFSSGIVNGGSSDPVNTSPPNFGWQTTNYPSQGQGSGTGGVMFMVSTADYYDVRISFDTRHSNTSSRWVRLDYTTDGGSSWVLGSAARGTIYEGTSGDTWFNLRSGDLTGQAGVADNALFGFRMVTVFGPASGPFDDTADYMQYFAANSTSNYSSSGTLRWDMVTVSGEPVPEPATMGALALGVAMLARRRRR